MSQWQQNLEETIPIGHHFREWGKAFVYWYIFGLLIFHAVARFDWSSPEWDKAYYIWQFTKDALAVIAIGSVHRKIFRAILPIIIYSIIRVCLEILTIFVTMGHNSEWIVTVLFLVALFAAVLMSLRELNEAREI